MDNTNTTPVLGSTVAYSGTLPAGFLACDGSAIPIRQYVVLFSVLGTKFGGDGSTTFAVPKLPGFAICIEGAFPTADQAAIIRASVTGQISMSLVVPVAPAAPVALPVQGHKTHSSKAAA